METHKEPPKKAMQVDSSSWRELILNRVSLYLAGLGAVALVIYSLSNEGLVYKIIACVLYSFFLASAIRIVPRHIRAGIFLGTIYIVALITLLDTGDISGTIIFFLGWISLAALVISEEAGWIATGVSLSSLLIIGWLFLSEIITPWSAQDYSGIIVEWVMATLYLIIFAISTQIAINQTLLFFQSKQEQAASVIENLEQEKIKLIASLNNVTADLQTCRSEMKVVNTVSERRAGLLEAISQVTSSLTGLRTKGELLPRLVDSIAEKFGYYHVALYLTDPDNQFALLSAVNHPEIQKNLEVNKQIKIGEQGLIGYVTLTGLPRIALDTSEEKLLVYDEFPDTRSEIVLPLMVAGNIIGALDMHSKEMNAFKDEDMGFFLSLANQVSMMIDNANLFDQTKRSLTEAEALSRQYLREGWSRLSMEEKLAGIRYSKQGITILPNIDETAPIDNNTVDVPIVLRGERVGSLCVRPPEGNSFTPDQMDLIKAVADRVALSTENARLFSDVSKRAEREKTVSQITTSIRSTTDPNLMLQTAIEELRKILDAQDITIRPLSPQNQDESSANI